MIMKISRSKARSRKMMMRGFLRWLFYSIVLLLFYLWETNPLIPGFCPLLIIPLATAVAMREGELAAAVFGMFCGFMLDTASGTLFGFSSLWLLICCPLLSLLSSFWIKVNIVSYTILNAGVTVLMGALDFLFLHWVWEGKDSAVSFVHAVLPAYIGALVGALPVYFIVLFISRKLSPREERRLEESVGELSDPYEEEKSGKTEGR